MIRKSISLLLLSLTSSMASAGTMGPPPPPPMVDAHPWSITGTLGYGSFDYAASGEGQTPIGRLAIGKSFMDFGRSSIGLEMGVQNGKTMDLFIPQGTLDLLGGLPIQATITPFIDLLGTIRMSFNESSPFFADVKLGAAYRRLNVIGRDTVDNKSQFAGEVQAGIGACITEISTLSILYQGVYGGSLNFKVDEANATATIGNIPVQNSILLSANVLLNV